MSKMIGDLNQKLAHATLRPMTAVAGLVLSASVVAESHGAGQREIDEIIVYDHGRSSLHLQENTAVGGRLGLSVFDLPGSVDVIDHQTMTLRGDYDAVSAITRSTGIVSSAAPGNGGTSVSARGFNGHGSVITSYDGNRLFVGAGSVTFPVDTWLMERVEVLRGPGSVIHGIGATGATVNYMPKSPSFGESSTSVLMSAGSFGSQRFGLGTGARLSDSLAFRADGIYHSKDGHVDHDDQKRQALATSFLYQPNSDLRVKLSVDYADVDGSTYFGTPLVDGKASKSLRKKNFNVRDAVVSSRDLWPRVQVDWRLSENVTFRNNTYYMDVERHWRNLESYRYDAGTGLVDRSDYLEILHEQEQFGSRSDLLIDVDLAGMENKLTVGFEFNQSDFAHINNAPYDGAVSSVPVSGFDPGYFQWEYPTTLDYMTDLKQYAIFFDDVLSLTDRWSLVFGARYDHLDFEREDMERMATNNQPAAFFDTTFSEYSWRVGTVYRLTDSLNLYAQYSTSPDAIGSIASLNVDAQELDLTDAEQFEVGAKQSFWAGRGEATVALFNITKRNLFTRRDGASFGAPLEQVGKQSSRGIELGLGLRPVDSVALNMNLAWVDAEFDSFEDLSGNTPPHVADLTANLWVDWYFAPGWQLGTGLRYVDERFTNNGNSELLPSYTVMDANLHWQASESVTAFVRARNLNDAKDYVISSSGGKRIFAEPRAFEAGVEVRF